MNNRIHKLFNEKNGNILSIYFTAGFPALHDTTAIIDNLDKAGVDLIEIGFPFSDPLADGPVIQNSSTKAIVNGMTLKLLFEQLETIRIQTQIPIILMGYLNPILQYGEEKFIEKCAEIEIDGVIVPDMPLDYYQTQLQDHFRKNNLSNILLITPETNENRIRLIDENSDGFIYMVSSNSITGRNNNIDHQVTYFNRINKMNLNNPKLIGFGIHSKETFETACKYSMGAIIGSAFIKHLSESGSTQESIHQFTKTIRS